MFLFPTMLIGQGALILQQLQQVNVALLSMPLVLRRRTQVASASNRNIITGNLGAVLTGAQNASPLNVGRR